MPPELIGHTRRIEQRGIHTIRDQAEQCIRARDPLEQRLARHHPIAEPLLCLPEGALNVTKGALIGMSWANHAT